MSKMNEFFRATESRFEDKTAEFEQLRGKLERLEVMIGRATKSLEDIPEQDMAWLCDLRQDPRVWSISRAILTSLMWLDNP